MRETADISQGGSLNSSTHVGKADRANSGGRSSSNGGSGGGKRSGSMGKEAAGGGKTEMVLKVTSILSRQQRDIAEKEAKLLSRLSHPSIVKMYDTCYRTVPGAPTKRGKEDPGKPKERPQHLILMELCEGGHALDVCSKLAANGEHFDLSALIIAFGQICNAVSYLHAQRPPIVHRDLKPANFLVKNSGYKLCDFGSAVFGHVDLRTPDARMEAEEVIQKTTTQMFRSPEMVDLYMAKKLTQATDVWALGCCLYSLAFLQNCFEEGSNLAILSRKYKIPEDNPYGEGLVELLDRMLTVDCKQRADMTEVILCLSAVYSGRPLPPRKDRKPKKEEKDEDAENGAQGGSKGRKKNEKGGSFRTDGQGIFQDLSIDPKDPKLNQKEAKKLDPNSAAARRRMAAGVSEQSTEFSSFNSRFDEAAGKSQEVNADKAFSTDAFEAFDSLKVGSERASSANDVFASFESEEDQNLGDEVKNAFDSGFGNAQFDASFGAFGDSAMKESKVPANEQESAPLPTSTETPSATTPEVERKRRTGTVKPRRKKKTEDDGPESTEDTPADDGGEGDADGEERRTRRAPTSRSRVRRTASSTTERRPGELKKSLPSRTASMQGHRPRSRGEEGDEAGG